MAVKQTLTLTQLSQDVAANTSQVRVLWKSTQTGESRNLVSHSAYYWIDLGGGETKHTVTYVLHKSTTDTILDLTVTVPHDSQGKGTVRVRTWMDTRISAGEVTLSKALTLADIPQAGTVSATDTVIGGKSTVVVTCRDSSYTHSIAFRFGALSGYLDRDGTPVDTEVIHTAAALNFPIPESFYEQIPDSPTGVCTLTCRTYSGETVLGENTGSFTVTADPAKCGPSVLGTVEDCNGATLALTGDGSRLISRYSTALCTVEAQARGAATIVEKKICGVAVEEDSLQIPNVETSKFVFSAVDSRGYTGQYEVIAELIPYELLTLNGSVSRADPTGPVTVTVSGSFYDGGFGVASNTLALSCRVDGGEEIPMTPTLSDGGYTAQALLEGLDYAQSHSLTVTAADALTTVERWLTVQPGIPVFDWGQRDFCFHVPVRMPKLFLGDTEADMVTEQGSDGIWHYRKWASGLAECWGETTYETAVSTAWGNLYVAASPVPRQAYPFTFAQVPFEQATVRCDGWALWSYAQSSGTDSGSNTTTQTALYGIARGTAMTAAAPVAVRYHVLGCWK